MNQSELQLIISAVTNMVQNHNILLIVMSQLDYI